MAEFGDAEKPIVITEHGWPTHDATVKGASILLAGLKVARPERKVWRAVYAATAGEQQQSIAAAIEAILPPGSTSEACLGARLRERLAATGVWRSEWTRPDGTVAGGFWKPGETEDPVFYEDE